MNWSPLDPMTLVTEAWIVLMLYWAFSALRVKQMKYIAPASVRFVQLIFLVPGCILLFKERSRVGMLHMQVLPSAPAIIWIGVGIAWLGIAFAIWARYVLGGNWSSAVAIREGHELIRSGPYRVIRHPIYTGIIIGGWGTAVVAGQLGAFIGVILITLGFAYKGNQEELRLHATFGDAWLAHRRRTGMFLPKLR